MQKGFRKRKRHSCRLFISLPEPDDTRTSGYLLRSSLPAKFRQSDMARTRGAKSSSPSGRKRVPREAPVQGPTSEPPRPEAASPQVKPTPQNPPARRYLTRSGGRPLQKRARVESSKPINLTEQSLVPSPEPSPAPSPAPAPMSPAQPQEHQPPLSKPQIPSGVAPEVLIRHPMLTQPPIEGNLDCRARQFHS